MAENTSIHPDEYQGVTIWTGDGSPAEIDDVQSAEDIRGYIAGGLQRRVVVARLRFIIDALEGHDLAKPKPFDPNKVSVITMNGADR